MKTSRQSQNETIHSKKNTSKQKDKRKVSKQKERLKSKIKFKFTSKIKASPSINIPQVDKFDANGSLLKNEVYMLKNIN